MEEIIKQRFKSENLETMNPQIPVSESASERRTDYRIILDMLPPQCRVLDLGCGTGGLLTLLRDKKQARGYGIELSSQHIIECVGKGLSVFHGDIDEGLRDFEDQSFDYVIVNQTLSATHRPELVLDEVLRVGRIGIVSFANFAYWRLRFRLLFSGRMPVTESMPYEWFDTPNIHLFSIRDFRIFCRRHEARVIRSCYFNNLEGGKVSEGGTLANWSAAYALFALQKAY